MKLKNVDPIVGPEMKSTGEVLGIGHNYEKHWESGKSGSRFASVIQS